jgi:cytochrome c oxidase subunit 1
MVESATPLWDAARPKAYGLRVEQREVLLTTVFEARPDLREPSPMPTIWPAIAAVATTVMFVCSIFTPWAVAIGSVPIAAALIAWFWPKDRGAEGEPEID